MCGKERRLFKLNGRAAKRGLNAAYCSYHCAMLADGVRSRCHAAVARLIQLGALDRPANLICVDCGKQAAQYDHRDYTHPIDVEPVCRQCNLLRGPGLYATSERAVLPFFCPNP